MAESEYNLEELDRKVNYLIDTVRQLERKLSTLEKLLEQKNNPISLSSVQVNGAMEIPTITKVNLSETELVESYNNNYQVLASKAIKVSVTEDSLRKKYNDTISLTELRNGNYWIVATENDTYWLLPRGNLRVDTYNYETVKSLFKCDGYQADVDSKFTFTLIKPARVSRTPNGLVWTLAEPGVLNFSKTSLDKSEETNSEVLEEDSTATVQSDSLDNSEGVLRQNFISDEYYVSPEALLIATYNEKKDSLLIHSTEVSETEESINRLRLGIKTAVVFEKVTLGKYWILTVEGLNYLVPKWDINISVNDLETVQDLFECQGYQTERHSQFKLIKPAKVSPLTQGEKWVLVTLREKWVLVESGVIQFQ